MMPSVSNLFTSNGHGDLLIPGGCTGPAQTCDSTLHGPYDKLYKCRESHDAFQQLSEGMALPCCKPQTVVDRSLAAWHDVDHEKVSRGFVRDGVANDLHGREDHLLSHEIAPVWAAMQLKSKREDIGRQIEKEVAEGKWTKWLDFKKDGFLIEYGAIPVLPEGSECFDEGSGAANKDDESDADVKSLAEGELDDDDDPEPLGDLSVAPPHPSTVVVKYPAELDPIAPLESEPVAADGAAGSELCLGENGEDVEETLSKMMGDGKETMSASPHLSAAGAAAPNQGEGPLVALPGGAELFSAKDEAAIQGCEAGLHAILQAGTDKVAEKFLRERLMRLKTQKRHASDPGALYLRERTMQRKDENDKIKKQREDRNHDLAKAKLALKVEEQKTAQAKAAGAIEKAEVKKRTIALQKAKDKAKADAAVANMANRAKNLKLAAHFTKQWQDTINADIWDKLNKLAQQLEDQGVKPKAKDAAYPQMFEPVASLFDNVAVKTNFDQNPPMILASTRFSHYLFNGLQSKCGEKQPLQRLKILLAALFPRYVALMGYEFTAGGLLGKHKNNVDAAFLEGAWRYTRLLGKDGYRIMDSRPFFQLPMGPGSSAGPSGTSVTPDPPGVSGSSAHASGSTSPG